MDIRAGEPVFRGDLLRADVTDDEVRRALRSGQWCAVRDRNGEWVGRVDFWWPHAGVIGEYDGEIKYGRLLRPGQDAAAVVYREKLREDALRAQPGVRTVVRRTWRDVTEFDALATRLRDLLGSGVSAREGPSCGSRVGSRSGTGPSGGGTPSPGRRSNGTRWPVPPP